MHSPTVTPFRLRPALPVISIVGLDRHKKPHHARIFEQISKSGSTTGITFLERPVDFLYLRSSSSTNLQNIALEQPSSLDGIIKADWLKHQLTEKPQVIAFFIELSWFDPSFHERTLEFSSQVSILKTSINKAVKIAVIVVQPEENGERLADPLNNSEKQAAEKLQQLARTVEISPQHVAQISIDRLERTCDAVRDGLRRMVGLVCDDKIKNLKNKISALPRNGPVGSLKSLIRFNFKLAIFLEIKCEIENTTVNERACFKAYRQAYEIALDPAVLEGPKSSSMLSCVQLEVLAMLRLVSCRLIQFTLVQAIDISNAVQELQKHIATVKQFLFASAASNSKDTFIALTTLYNQYTAEEKSYFANVIARHWSTASKDAPKTSSPGDYYLQAAKHLLIYQQNLEHFNHSNSSALNIPERPAEPSLWLSLDSHVAPLTGAQYLAREVRDTLPHVRSTISTYLTQARHKYDKHESKSRKLLAILIEIAGITPNPEEQLELLRHLKDGFIPANPTLPNQPIFNSISTAFLKNKDTKLHERLASAFELGNTSIFANILTSASLTGAEEVLLQPGFVKHGSFVCGFREAKVEMASEPADVNKIKIKFVAVSKIAKVLEGYSSEVRVVIGGERGTEAVVVSREDAEMEYSGFLGYDEAFTVKRVEMVIKKDHEIKFILPQEVFLSKVSTLHNRCEYMRPVEKAENGENTPVISWLTDDWKPTVEYVHDELFMVKLEDAQLADIASIAHGNQSLPPAKTVYFTKVASESTIILTLQPDDRYHTAPLPTPPPPTKSIGLDDLTITAAPMNSILQVGKWNTIQVTVGNNSLIPRRISVLLNSSYDQELRWSSSQTNTYAMIPPKSSKSFEFTCIPLAPIEKLFLSDYFSALDLTRSQHHKYTIEAPGKSTPFSLLDSSSFEHLQGVSAI